MIPNNNILTNFRPSKTIGNQASEHLTGVLQDITLATQTKEIKFLKALKEKEKNLKDSLELLDVYLNSFCNYLKELEQGKKKVNNINPSSFINNTKKIIDNMTNTASLIYKRGYYQKLKKNFTILHNKIKT